MWWTYRLVDDRLREIASTLAATSSTAPVMMIGDQTYGKLTGNEAVKIVKNIRLAENN